MSDASTYLRALGNRPLAATELSRFIELLGYDCAAADDIEHLLRVTELNPDQVVSVARSEGVRRSAGAQLALKRYVRAKEYAAADERSRKEAQAKWANTRDFLMALASMPPGL